MSRGTLACRGRAAATCAAASSRRRSLPPAPGGGLRAYLPGLASDQGANTMRTRVSDVDWDGERPRVHLKDGSETYDLLIGATGINSSGWGFYQKVGFVGGRG